MTGFRWALGLACGSALLIVIFAVPYLPLGTDLYVHVLWPWQVMRCLSAGSLPVWLPDLNAGFGSPGIGLYSPGAPLICGVLGLLFGTVGRGLRAALALGLILVVVVVPGRDWRSRLMMAAAIALSPALVVELFGRFPVAQLLSVPPAAFLLHRAIDQRWSWRLDGVVLAVLWLLHAPTAFMVGVIGIIAPFVGGERFNDTVGFGVRSGTISSFDSLRGVIVTAATSAGLTAWHWWPLLTNAAKFSFRSALTGGDQDPLRNLIGAEQPHLGEINLAMGWAAVGLLVAILVVGGWRTGAGRLVVLTVFLSTSLSTVIWKLLSPLAWINFPWRWLLPATLLAVPVIVATGRPPNRARRCLAVVALMLPLLGAPSPVLVRDPGLTADTAPLDAGRRVATSFSGNPLLVDVREHRPLWWESLAPTLEALDSRRAILLSEVGTVEVVEWAPLRRVLDVTAPKATTVVIRLLADDHWWARVNGESVTPQRWGAALAVPMPQGQNRLEIFWAADWRAVLGALIALATVGGMAMASLRRGRRAAGVRRP